jgi:putative AdoMet-dependent methyltransferase
MRSQHVAEFNHDPWAAGYDVNVRNEDDPIRTGYAGVLAWTVARAEIEPQHVVVDLGVGSGNTSALIPAARQLIGVDISAKMMALAQPKLAYLADVRFVQSDLLEFFEQPRRFDRLISTYALHHLTEPEKEQLFQLVWRDLLPGGRTVFGDLMFADAAARAAIEAHYRAAGDAAMVETFAEEFFWLVDSAYASLIETGFDVVEVKRFSQLSWGICAVKPDGA